MLERGRRVIELEGPHRVTPNKIAAAFSKILGRHIRMEAVPRERREALFTSQGMKNPLPRIQMLDFGMVQQRQTADELHGEVGLGPPTGIGCAGFSP